MFNQKTYTMKNKRVKNYDPPENKEEKIKKAKRKKREENLSSKKFRENFFRSPIN